VTLPPEADTRYDLLVSDVDGTLVGEDKVVSRGVIDAVKAAQRRGVRVCLATGRMWDATRPFVEVLGADPPVILYNGGLVYDFASGRTLTAHRMSPQSAVQVLRMLRRFPQTSPLLFVHGKVCAERRTPLVDLFARRDRLTVEMTPQFEPLLTEGPMKFLVVGDPAHLQALSRALGEIQPPVNRVASQRDYLEILPPGISKGAALPVLARALGVPLARVVAVGDALNDLTLLEAAGMGIAVQGSPRELLAVADWVCPPPEQEGVREVIERMFLSQPA
jgi:Cof subfamily protein (haloacid dehalogenase superfamily)